MNDTEHHCPERRAALERMFASLSAVSLLSGCGGGGSGGLAGSTVAESIPTSSPLPSIADQDAVSAASPDDARIAFRSLDTARLVVFKDYLDGSPYERFQRLTVLTGAIASIPFKGWDLKATGVPRTLASTTYRLLVDGSERASQNMPAGSVQGSFSLDLSPLAEGWHVLDIVGDGSESTPQWVIYVQKGAQPVAQSTMPVLLGTHALVMHKAQTHQFGFVPARFTPIQAPTPAREYPTFAEALPRSALVQTELVPWRPNDIHRPNLGAAGILNTFNYQSYFWDSLTAKHPSVTLLDGPRGVGTVGMATHLQVARGGNVYFCDAWRMGRITASGTVTTLAGYRHASPPQHSKVTANDVELVGDWSAVPASRRGFHEVWGMAWDARTLATNEAAVSISNPVSGLVEKPHARGPIVFVSDTQNNRVCRVEFDAASHDVPAKVSEFLTSLHDPWDVVCGDGVLYVSERTAHRISAFDASTGAFIRTVVQGSALAELDRNRVAKRLAGVTLDQVRAEPCVLPEGLYLLDSWLYFGSLAQQQVKRVHLETGVIEVAMTPNFDLNSKFVKIAVSDGSFYPRGYVFACNWGVFSYGRPQGLNVGINSAGFGPGLPWETLGYPCAVAVGLGRLVCSSSSEGILVVSKALPTDTAINENRWKQATNDYEARGLRLSHGPGGWGYYGLGLPWGVSADIDFYLAAHGHRR